MKNIEISSDYLVNTEGTSDGCQDKYYKDGCWYKTDFFGGEGHNEYVVSKVLECSNLTKTQYVKYDEIYINDLPGCVSRDCTESEEQLVSLYRLHVNIKGIDPAETILRMDMDDAIEYMLSFVNEQTGLDLRTYFANMFTLAYLVLNTDTHFSNIQLIFDTNSGIFHEAPYFDHGKSFFCGDKKYEPSASVGDNIKHLNFRPFSASARLMSEYLKNNITLRFKRETLAEISRNDTSSYVRSVLQYQLENPFFDEIIV